MVETAVLFVTFARPEYAKQTFAAIKKAQPKKLYFYSNKAREDKPDEVKRNNEVRALVDDIDWDCELVTWFRNDYVDVYKSTWGAYDWVFHNEEQAICLEEDCVPSLAFFDFCDQLLPKYKEDQRIWVISGNNANKGFNTLGYDYIFTSFLNQYGWASWSDRWKKIERNGIDIDEILKLKLYHQLYLKKEEVVQATKSLKKMKNEDGVFLSPAWDHMFQMSMRVNGAFGIVPLYNTVANIGVSGEHQKHKSFAHTPLSEIEYLDHYSIMKHPKYMIMHLDYASARFQNIQKSKKGFFYKVLRYFIKIK